jgi:protease I
MPLPDSDFDPTESGVPWCTMRDHGHNVVFATPTGRTARADPKMVTGEGLGTVSQSAISCIAAHARLNSALWA